jgi:hypothetical protein
MKSMIYLCLFLLLAGSLQAQVADPSEILMNPKTLSKKHTKEIQKTTITKSGSDSTVQVENIDSVYTVDTIIRPRAMIYGLTSLNNANNDVLNSLNGTGRLGFILLIGKHGGLKLNMGVNLLNANPSKGISRDSVDFNSLMFPESGNFGFLFNPSVRLKKWDNEEHSLWADASFAYRKVSVDSPNISFKSLVYSVGLKYQWKYKIDEEKGNLLFTLMPYWNYFNIPDEDVTKFNTILSDSLFEKVNRTAAISSIGVKTSVQYKNVMFFFDIRSNLNTMGLRDENPFKGTKVNIGFVTAFSFKNL